MGQAHDVGRRGALVVALACGAALVAGCAGGAVTSPSGAARSPSGIEAGPGPTTTPPPSPSPSPTPAPVFAATASAITPELAERMTASWRPGCPVPLTDLRYLNLTFVDFDGVVRTGELVVHADAVEAITRAFGTLFAAGYPIRSMRLVDDFGADDDASMAADNTSAFNCRPVAGTGTWSQHAFGRAIDVNPVENPYVDAEGVDPPAGEPYANRPDAPGVLHATDAAVTAFEDEGWHWGGTWPDAKDYQHFSTTGT